MVEYGLCSVVGQGVVSVWDQACIVFGYDCLRWCWGGIVSGLAWGQVWVRCGSGIGEERARCGPGVGQLCVSRSGLG